MRDQTIKADKGKLRISLVPTEIIRAIARVREYGVNKYGARESWRLVEPERYRDALLRHVLLWMEDPHGRDAESGCCISSISLAMWRSLLSRKRKGD